MGFDAIFRHSEETIRRLEQAGLGYNVQSSQTKDKLGTCTRNLQFFRFLVYVCTYTVVYMLWIYCGCNILSWIERQPIKCIKKLSENGQNNEKDVMHVILS